MKLDVKQTVKIGFAFLSISAFWQLYNNVVPLTLTNTFSLNEVASGVIMALDNVFALVLLPLFGALSDRARFKMGRRKPFILCGTLAAVVLMMLVPFLDNRYAASQTPVFRTAYVAVLLLLLIAMGTYRSPAVALMPDVTPKPLRSRGNAIINLMGALGVMVYLGLTAVLYSGDSFQDESGHVDYTLLFVIVAAMMLAALFVLMFAVDEVGLSKKMQETEERQAPSTEASAEQETAGKGKLSPEVFKSLVFLLFSISFWFMSYNAVETWFTTFADHAWHMTLGAASLCLTVTTIGMVLSFIPAGKIAEKAGRKKTIMAGLVFETATFAAAFIYTLFFDTFHPALYGMFFLLGVAWALINVNSLPMVVDMCKAKDVGRYTGFYYTFSMAAQSVTPVVAGWIIRNAGYKLLFLYSAVFMALAFCTMHFVRHGDTAFQAKSGLEAFEDL